MFVVFLSFLRVNIFVEFLDSAAFFVFFTMASPEIIVIGAGPSGIALAHTLKHKLGFDDFTVSNKGNKIHRFQLLTW